MNARIIDGKAEAAELLAAVRREVEVRGGRPPCLVPLMVGDPAPPSQAFLAGQRKAAAAAGITVRERVLPAHAGTGTVRTVIHALNQDPSVDGIVLQRPLPPHLEAPVLVEALAPEKDVEGIHPANLGAVVHGRPGLAPCTAAAAVHLFETTGLPPRGAEVVVVGHSEIVGKPIALLMVHRLATVTICHIGTRALEDHVRRAEVLFVAAGVPGLIRGEAVRPGACVIDIGINRVEVQEEGKRIRRIVGDTVFEEVKERAAFLTPVPGGVGPVTTAMLMKNTLEAARRARP